MLLIYQPRGEEPQRFDFQPLELLASEAELIEEEGGGFWDTYPEFGEKFFTGSIRARRVLLWIFLRRTRPDLELSDVEFRIEEFRAAEDEQSDMPVGKDTASGDAATDSPSATAA
jgi:hypothetical protein